MNIFECKICGFGTLLRPNFNRHLKTEKHKRNVPAIKIAEENPKKEYDGFQCDFCDKTFSHSPSMYRHMKHRCPKNQETDVQKMVRAMKLQQKTHEKQIQQIISHLQPNHTTNNTTNNTVNIQNITLLAYKDTDTSHLTTKDYMHCIKEPHGMTHLIEKIHFNPMKPENRNISMSNLKDKYMMMYDGEQWLMVHKDKIGDIYTHKEILMSEWVEEHPEVKDKFCRYIQDVDADVRSRAEEDIKLMIYNKSI
jgi:hypothetical protein